MNLPRRIEENLGPMRQGTLRADDGQVLAYQLFGDGPPVLWANGIGVRYPVFHQQIGALRDGYQHLCWDYRGIGGSVMERHDGDVSIARHARDALCLLDHLNIPSTVAIGWSMGAQVLLEIFRERPSAIRGLAVLHGAPGKLYYHAFPWALADTAGALFQFAADHPWLMQRAFDLATALPQPAFRVLQAISFVNSRTDAESFNTAMSIVAQAEKRIYARTMMALAEHDATEVLPRIDFPTLVVTGSQDYITPPHVGLLMAQNIPGARYEEAEGSSHFSIFEQPELVNRWIAELLAGVIRR